MEKNLTHGSVFKNIVFFSLPYLLSYFLQTLYGMADLFIIGQFASVADTTAVSVGSQIMHMLTVMIVGLAMGTTVSIANAVGAGEQKKSRPKHREYRHAVYEPLRCAHGASASFGASDHIPHGDSAAGGRIHRFLSHRLLSRHSVYHCI